MSSKKNRPSKLQPVISGHETFTLKYGWIKKIVDEIGKAETANPEDTKTIFSDPSSIVRFGIGKNMVNSLKYWAKYVGLIDPISYTLTKFAKDFFSDDGCDPYLESSETVWLVHYKLVCNEQLVTYSWFFNNYNGGAFDRKSILSDLVEQFEKEGWRLASEATLKRDVECFIRLYSSKNITKAKATDESIESPLRELGLIKEGTNKNVLSINREEKLGLSAELALYMVLDFWEKQNTNQTTLSFNSLLYDKNSIGRLCLLNESALNKIILDLDKKFSDQISWAETSGMRQFSKVSGKNIGELRDSAYDQLINKINGHAPR